MTDSSSTPLNLGDKPLYAEWKASHVPTSSRKRKRQWIYQPSAQEFYPALPWYALHHEEINLRIAKMCDELVMPLRYLSTDDPAIVGLCSAADAAKKIPDLTQVKLAVPGEQGIGKSSLLNAILHRKLLDTSGSSTACTSFATIIVYKPGAQDDAQSSDIIIEVFNENEIIGRIREQIELWANVHPGTVIKNQDVNDEDEDSSSDEEEDTVRIGLKDGKNQKKVSASLRRGASTAKEFFCVIFNTSNDKNAQSKLDELLHDTDIRTGNFFQLCVEKTKERLEQVDKQIGLQNEVSKHSNISDRDLVKTRNIAKELWPFIKVVTISTGHVLLRNGLCFIDLPGYGDSSQLRDTVINDYRWKADFEMVVTPISRIRSSLVHERYLARSIHIKGAEKTILVMNKSDLLLCNEDEMRMQIDSINEAPFPALSRCLADADAIEEDIDEDFEDPELKNYVEEVLRDASAAYVKRETEIVKDQMDEKGVKILTASAFSYEPWNNPRRRQDPRLDPEASGIPAIRRLLFSLPAESNLLIYRNLVFVVLPALRDQAGRVLEKHIEDKSYADMRKALKEQIPILKRDLERFVATQLRDCIVQPWTWVEKEDIDGGIQNLARQEWVSPVIYYGGFTKILRENGIPINGKYLGRNLNQDLLRPLEKYINQWHKTMLARAEQLGEGLDKLVGRLGKEVKSCIDKSSAAPALKQRAMEALTNMSERIDVAYRHLLEALNTSLRNTHLRFTTEIDIHCPIAREMKQVYEAALRVRAGKGVYDRLREAILGWIVTPVSRKPGVLEVDISLAKMIGEKIMVQQTEVWKTDCDTFITDAITHLNEFLRITEELLMNSAYETAEHKKMREELRGRLAVFSRRLEEIQVQFTGTDPQPPNKRLKFEHAGN
ncbi:hypothetical protein P153DRAFT_358456 [Dothidotthia symphoricarpi CBS 119687]|uniref:P-loop containing nucleoside triphosphate hydrolase protein n=1 Tax=Dothidotthia symphoricarpi CBS 119687 TaxID=1392245 RepID=A0A6A6A911_9PLEO|nr:uncharacterized protein P153DRAFT_358456 [Dothidotthia symphoricarpi CBS 119687]KAF2127584.1 hypothetical protein P153DRAFT_358456 [Dothidotthia symphoricarpi CBS 119687]